MKRDVSVKTTGQLLDELVTNAFKSGYAALRSSDGGEFDARYELLRRVLDERLGPELSAVIHDLAVVSLATWQAQEVVMSSSASDRVAAEAGRQSQRLNARRSGLIREIDRLLGEADVTITTKTYG
jgi:hypothetical protein